LLEAQGAVLPRKVVVQRKRVEFSAHFN
jgi:hypothetical protein